MTFKKLLLFSWAIVGLTSVQKSFAQNKNQSTSKNKSNSTMKQVVVSQKVKSSADKIWAILRAGGDLDKWLPIISTCKLEGTGAGAKRYCTTPDGKSLKETILEVNDTRKVFRYKIDEQDMLPTKNYIGTVSVIENSDSVTVNWVADFDMTIEEAYPQVEKGLTDLLQMAIASLDAEAQK